MVKERKRRAVLNLKMVIFAFLVVACEDRTLPPAPLFDGLSLTGWRSNGDVKWLVEDGAIVGADGDGYLASDQIFKSYRLKLEFKVHANTNSGVFVHCQDPEEISPVTCFEINIWDEHPRQEYRTGAIVTLKSPVKKIDTLGDWNYYDILVTEKIISVTLNGTRVSWLDVPNKSSGFIALQKQNEGWARFRNITLEPIIH